MVVYWLEGAANVVVAPVRTAASKKANRRMERLPVVGRRRSGSGRIQDSKIRRFAEVLALATEALGTQDAAERWLERPVMALDRNRPIDLLSRLDGMETVKDLLGRLQYGVYT